MSTLDKYLEEINPYLEMSNLRNDKTGLSLGTIYISTEQGDHGPRVKFYRGRPGKSQPSASISISLEPEVFEDDINIKPKEKKEIYEFVKKNCELLLEIWNNGTAWYKDEWDKKVSQLKKI